jgi:hypothetical protein
MTLITMDDDSFFEAILVFFAFYFVFDLRYSMIIYSIINFNFCFYKVSRMLHAIDGLVAFLYFPSISKHSE